MADPRVSNPAYEDPYLAGLASNIGKMFGVGDMGRTIVQRAQARHYQLQNDKLAMEAAKRGSVAGLFRNANGGAITPQQFDAITADSIEGGLKPGDVSGMTLYRQSNTGQPDSVIARAVVGDGKTLGKNDGVSLGDREAVASRENNEAARRSSISAGPGYAAVAESRRNNDAKLAFQERTRFDAPHNTGEGAAVNFNPADPRFAGVAQGSIPAPKPVTASQLVETADPVNPDNTAGVYTQAAEAIGQPKAPGRIGADKTVVVEGPDGKPVYMKASDAIKSQTPATTARQPVTPDTKEAEANLIVTSALDSIGATLVDANGFKVIHPDFIAQYGDKLVAAKEAAVEARKSSKNPGAAEAAFLQALGVPSSRMFKPANKTFGFGADSAMVDRPGRAPSAPPPAAAAPPANSSAIPTVNSPAEAAKLPRGTQFRTPDGKLRVVP